VVPEGVNEVRFDEQRYCIDNLAGSEYIATDTSTHTIGLGHRTVRMTSENLKTVVLWSEEPSRFVCVEPTLNGNSFFDHATPPEQELLAPGETKDYSFSLLI
jgi:galactose mutarotase-like enzyme